ncbi:MAG: hypothetical protein WC558_07710 [Patulibacter sp.]
MRSHHFAAPFLIAALALAGCGGSDDEGPTKAEYIAKADAICKTEGEKSQKAATDAVVALGTEDPTPEQLQVIATSTIIPGLEKQVGDLKALDKPKDDEEEIDAIYAALDTAINAGKEDPSTLTGAAGANPFDDANKKAVAYGLKECGSE